MNQRVIVLIETETFRPEVEYVFGYLLSLIGLSCRVILPGSFVAETDSSVIIYANRTPENAPSKYIWIRPSAQFWQNYLRPESLPQSPLSVCDGVPILFAGDKRSVYETEKCLTTDFDIVGSAFFLLTRYEEYLITSRDQHGRFSAKSSVLSGTGAQRMPLVNLYSRLLRDWLQKVFEMAKDERQHNRFHYLLTHDIDHLRLFSGLCGELRKLGSLLIRRRSVVKSVRFLSEKVQASFGDHPDPYQTLDYLMDRSEERGAVSTFLFMTARDDPRDGSYAPDTPQLNQAVQAVLRRGHEIGLHGSYRSSCDAEALAQQKRILEVVAGREVSLLRQHYLRFVAPDSWQSQSQAGFDVDFSLGYAEEIGFRAGTATPFLPFDLRQRRRIDILEFSNIIMDGTLFEPQYMALTMAEAMAQCSEIINQVRRVNGVLVLLWHNSSLTDFLEPGWRTFYSELLSLLDGSGGVPTSPSSLVSDWRSRLAGRIPRQSG
jgi:peptidoglycan/xylan/chitin deacetylase (PgdA/CDA1 family)